MSSQDLTLYFLRMLCSWSVEFNNNETLHLLGFADSIMDESLRAYCFRICPFRTWVTSPSYHFNTTLAHLPKTKEKKQKKKELR